MKIIKDQRPYANGEIVDIIDPDLHPDFDDSCPISDDTMINFRGDPPF